MPMMEIGIVRMPVHYRFMPVPVIVRLARRIVRPVHMMMVLVMRMTMLMFHRSVRMLVLVTFGQMQPQANRHERTSHHQPNRQRLVEHCQREQRADERSQRKIGSRARRPEIAQAKHEQREAYAIAEKANHSGRQDGADIRQRRSAGPGRASD